MNVISIIRSPFVSAWLATFASCTTIAACGSSNQASAPNDPRDAGSSGASGAQAAGTGGSLKPHLTGGSGGSGAAGDPGSTGGDVGTGSGGNVGTGNGGDVGTGSGGATSGGTTGGGGRASSGGRNAGGRAGSGSGGASGSTGVGGGLSAGGSGSAAGNVIFQDNFDGSVLGSAWVALDRPGDSSNAEAQCYRPANSAVAGGFLTQTAKQDSSCSGFSYTASMVQWKSFSFTYGTVEFRAKLAGGKGTWAAVWMLGKNCQISNVTSADNIGTCDWPNPGSDEIDITEILNGDLTQVNQQVHTNTGSPGCRPSTTDVSQNFHTYKFIWAPTKMTWLIDGKTTCTATSSIPSMPMFLMINVAVGGGGGGTIDPSTFPQTSTIDYVTVTQ